MRPVYQLTLVFREGELVVRLLLDHHLSFSQPDIVLTFVVPDGGSADAGVLLLAEIVDPQPTARITGGKLVLTRHTEAKIEGSSISISPTAAS